MISVEPPNTVELEVVETDPGVKGNTAVSECTGSGVADGDAVGAARQLLGVGRLAQRYQGQMRRACSVLRLKCGISEKLTWVMRHPPMSLPMLSSCSFSPSCPPPPCLQSGGSKPAKLETGAVIQVPLFIQQGERIKVDTRSDSYLSRAN